MPHIGGGGGGASDQPIHPGPLPAAGTQFLLQSQIAQRVAADASGDYGVHRHHNHHLNPR